MSLPTIYRSTLLSGESTGWTTYAIDMSTYLGSGDDFLQVGFNSVYGGGNAHPRYNYYTSKYYMLYDRMNIELTDNVGNSWNITSTTTCRHVSATPESLRIGLTGRSSVGRSRRYQNWPGRNWPGRSWPGRNWPVIWIPQSKAIGLDGIGP